jgi:hypothetical protein
MIDLKSIMGYASNSPYRNNPYLDISTPEGVISMENTPVDLLGIDNTGMVKKMKANSKNPYKFDGDVVREIPVNPYMQRGGINQQLLSYLFDDDDEPEQPMQQAPQVVEENDNEELSLAKNERILRERQQEEDAMEQAMLSGENPYRRRTETDLFFDDDEMQAGEEFAAPGTITPDTYLQAIYGNEGGKTGVDPSNVRGSASGKYAIIKSGRKDLYNRYYSSMMTYDEFENKYNTSAAFEYGVARKLAEENIKNSKSPQEAIGRWYSPQHAQSGQWDVVPRPDFGNKLTVRQYVNNALKNIR